MFGERSIDVATETGMGAFDEVIATATAEGHTTCSTEFLQMGAIHAVMQGEFQVVLVDFREASAFVSMTNTASSGLSASDLADVPGSHPAKVIDSLRDNAVSPEVLEKMGSSGGSFVSRGAWPQVRCWWCHPLT